MCQLLDFAARRRLFATKEAKKTSAAASRNVVGSLSEKQASPQIKWQAASDKSDFRA
jgi:hypothetical protein